MESLIRYLFEDCKEQLNIPDAEQIEISDDKKEQFCTLRSLMNIREPRPISKEFLEQQDKFLKSIQTDIVDVSTFKDGMTVWKGDITKLKCDAIVNACNSKLLGCFYPCHRCIDNTIHTYAGIQLRLECNEIMEKQGHDEPNGQAKITSGYNLPAKHVIHTVGPIVFGKPTDQNCEDLKKCYESCLKLADENKLESIAFCCLSTGEFHFPNEDAAKIAVSTVRSLLPECNYIKKVVFCVFKEKDLRIYLRLTGSSEDSSRCSI